MLAASADRQTIPVVSLNVKRRNLNKGQVAIAAAESVAISSHSARKAAETFGVSRQYIDQAVALLQDAPKAAASVKAGRVSLTAAYEALKVAQGVKDGKERRRVRGPLAPF